MKFIYFTFLKGLLFLFLISTVNAQVKTKIYPNAISNDLLPLKGSVHKTINIEAPLGFSKLKMEAETDENAGGSNKFALLSSVEIDILKSGELIEIDGFAYYTLKIKSPSSLNTSLEFNEFELSENSILS